MPTRKFGQYTVDLEIKEGEDPSTQAFVWLTKNDEFTASFQCLDDMGVLEHISGTSVHTVKPSTISLIRRWLEQEGY